MLLLVSGNTEQAECYSAFAAQQGVAQKLDVKQHQYGFAFVLTDFKLQGRTLPKPILSICKHTVPAVDDPRVVLCAHLMCARARWAVAAAARQGRAVGC